MWIAGERKEKREREGRKKGFLGGFKNCCFGQFFYKASMVAGDTADFFSGGPPKTRLARTRMRRTPAVPAQGARGSRGNVAVLILGRRAWAAEVAVPRLLVIHPGFGNPERSVQMLHILPVALLAGPGQRAVCVGAAHRPRRADLGACASHGWAGLPDVAAAFCGGAPSVLGAAAAAAAAAEPGMSCAGL